MADQSHDTDRENPGQPTRMARIAQRAHEIYERRGGFEGKDLDDWLQAEREIDAEIEAANASKPS